MSQDIAQEIVDTVLADLPGATQEMVDIHFRNTVRDFLMRSNSWRTNIGITTKKNKQEYTLDPVDSVSRVNYVMGVTRDGVPLTEIGFTARVDDLFYETERGSASNYYVRETNILGIVPIPASDSEKKHNITAQVSLLVRPGYTAIPEFLATHFFDGICAGILFRMMGQSSKPYTNKTMAEFYGKQFKSEAMRARSEAKRFWTQGPSGWKFPYFAKGRWHGRAST